jgi:hypothetical protein
MRTIAICIGYIADGPDIAVLPGLDRRQLWHQGVHLYTRSGMVRSSTNI